MTKTRKSLFSLILSLCMIFSFISTTLNTYALNDTKNTFDLISVAEWMMSQSTTTTYNTPHKNITILQNSNDIQEVKFVEGNKSNIVLYNKVTNELYIDGGKVVVEDVASSSSSLPVTLSSSSTYRYSYFSPSNHQYKCIKFEQQIYQMTISALVSAILWALPIPNGVASMFADAIATECTSQGYAYSDRTYCHSYSEVATDYSHYRQTWDLHWTEAYNDPSDEIESYSQLIW